ncbi:hypothetical protein MUB04_14480 [Acinetobacter indicus]|uniref:hypothetical protein n=1 Tax=Acinetobacter TaxID=469 RepID=UPI0015D3D2AF|nr:MULTISPECIES: hypothetical protein [Acinetobacter]MCP0917738.1 hypothetical protein [Acinetobacter indicus]
MNNTEKQNLKIQLETHAQFLFAWESLIKLGYHSDITPHTANYLYAHSDGRIDVDCSDVAGADLSQPNSPSGYFAQHENQEVSLDELLNMAKQYEQEQCQLDIIFLEQERPLFEANFIKLGGQLQYLKWEECRDGTGSYQADWDAIQEADIEDTEFDEQIQEHAEHVTGCLHSWVECAKSKAIPDGYFLMPMQPSEEMLKEAENEFNDLDIEDIQDRIVFSHQAMIQVLSKSSQ